MDLDLYYNFVAEDTRKEAIFNAGLNALDNRETLLQLLSRN